MIRKASDLFRSCTEASESRTNSKYTNKVSPEIVALIILFRNFAKSHLRCGQRRTESTRLRLDKITVAAGEFRSYSGDRPAITTVDDIQ